MSFFPLVGTKMDEGVTGFLHQLEMGLHRHMGHWRYSALVDFGTVLVLYSLFNFNLGHGSNNRTMDIFSGDTHQRVAPGMGGNLT